MGVVFYVRASRYHGENGWTVGSRGMHGWPISIFVRDRRKAEFIRDAYRNAQSGTISPEDRDQLVTHILLTTPAGNTHHD